MLVPSYKRSDFAFPIPDELIAQKPADPRDSSRLIVLHRSTGRIDHAIFRDLPDFLDASYTMVLNDAKVLPTRLPMQDQNSAKIDLYLLHEEGHGIWRCQINSLPLPNPGSILTCRGSQLELRVDIHTGDSTVRCSVVSNIDDMRAEMLRVGSMPLPPYVKSKDGEAGYQTVYAKHLGAVAAPTAGLHFTPQVFERLDALPIRRYYLTLYVGYGTFAYVAHDDLAQHDMHKEQFALDEVTAAAINAERIRGKRILAVGTTSTRVLESCANDTGIFEPRSGSTGIFIYPPYRFRAVDALLTNLHTPESTPLMLTCAFAGYDLVKRAYAEAVRAGYRFYSFGDAMLILP